VTAAAQGGFLLFVRGDTLMAQRFAAATLRLSAEPFPVAEQVGYSALFAQGDYAVSENGVLAYLRGGGQSQLTWFDRTGKRIGTIGEPGIYNGGFSLSPDEKRVAVALRDPETGTSDIWLIEVGRGVSSRLTFDPKDDLAPVWSPDGERLVFSSNRGGAFDLYQIDAKGGGREQLLLKSGLTKWAHDWSRDGRFLLYNETDNGTQDFLWMLPLFGDRKPVPFQKPEAWEGSSALSPDGKWVAFHSAELAGTSGGFGKDQIYVRAVPGTETAAPSDVAHRSREKWQISTGGGELPQWRRDGRELYYLAPDNRFMAVAVGADPSSQSGVPRVLFEASPGEGYAVTGDGQRFLILSKVEANATAATVVLNWTKQLKQ
jgi:Tol biopolymer transport system component